MAHMRSNRIKMPLEGRWDSEARRRNASTDAPKAVREAVLLESRRRSYYTSHIHPFSCG
jgi:hypothetical protein